MLKYTVNRRDLNKTKVVLPVDTIEFVDFVEEIENYQGINKNRVMLLCECEDIDKLQRGSKINTTNTLILDYGTTENQWQETYVFDNVYEISGLNETERSFSIFVDKYYTLNVSSITAVVYADFPEGIDYNQRDNIYLYCNEPHYFDATDEVIVYFRYYDSDGNEVVKPISFNFSTSDTLVTSFENFDDALFEMIFEQEKPSDDEEMDETEGNLGNITIYRDNFLFGEKTDYEFSFERATASINIPIVNNFDTNLYQNELLNEYFVENEKKKAINRIVDIEKDVYYPSIYTYKEENDEDIYTFSDDVYTIKFNLHFREHRGDNWLVDNDSYWNGVEQERDADGNVKENSAKINTQITSDNASDLLSFLNFTNDDVHYQKNRLKKSFLRLSYYDSINPANQNMLGYSTIFFDSGNLFAKYIKYMETDGYTIVGADTNDFGIYNPMSNKTGIRVDREHGFDDKLRLSSQLVVKSKNTSSASSEGFYVYIWKDNETTIPQDLYMKVEFNHAGYGRTVPFMIPYVDKKKHTSTRIPAGFKTFENIVDDFNNKGIDSPYGMRQYLKYSYLHLKYCYDKDNQIHRYFIDPKTYGVQTNNNEIIINLYEAKLG